MSLTTEFSQANRRVVVVRRLPTGLAVIAALATACSSAPGNALSPTVDGMYQAQSNGEFEAVQFVDSTHYLLTRNAPCSDAVGGTGSCGEAGTFVLDDKTLTLTEEMTKRVTEIPFQAMSTVPGAATQSEHIEGAGSVNLVGSSSGALSSGSSNVVATFSVSPAGQPSQLLTQVAWGEGCPGSCTVSLLSNDIYTCRNGGGVMIPSGNRECQAKLGPFSVCCG